MYPYPTIMSAQYLCQFHMLFQTIIYVCIIIIVTCIHAHNYVLIPYILMKFLIPYVMAITQPPCTTCTSNWPCNIFVITYHVYFTYAHFYVLYPCPNNLCKLICIHVTPRQFATSKSNSQKYLKTSLTLQAICKQ